MTKKTTIFVSILLLSAAVIIRTLLHHTQVELDKGLVELFTGFLFGAGIVLPFKLIKKKKNQ